MIKKLIEDVSKNAITHGSLPFWSWNDKLEEGELRRQIRNMHDLEMQGFFMHARGGLETEYMSDEWYDAINVCIDEARKLGMEAWSYDENGWPSGFAGGKLLEDPQNFARFLICKEQSEYPTEDVLAVYVIENGIPRRVNRPESECGQYVVIAVGFDRSYVDVLDPAITQRFIDVTHEEYKKRIAKADFGTVMPGFFTDEPQHYRGATPWSNIFRDAFLAEYGYDPIDHLPKLFIDCDGYREFRFDYRKLISKLYIEGFIKPLYEWCDQNGCQLTGHTIEESSITGQLHCCSGVMPFYQYQHIPGIDYLSRPLKKDAMAKQIGSVCAQTGRKKAITETFALCGWDVAPKELKNIADMQYAGGVNMMCQHLYAYSARGQRKRDYPAHYSEHLPWQKHLRDFNRYYNNLGYMLSLGEESARTLVIHPLHHAFMYYVRERDAEYFTIENTRLNTLSDLLSGHQIAYHYGDETMMKEMATVDGATIRMGLCTYDRVVVPDVETIDSSTASLLREYVKNGGIILLAGQVPSRIDARPADLSWLSSNVTFEELTRTEEVSATCAGVSVPNLRITTRRTESGRIIFLTNLQSDIYRDVTVAVQSCKNLVKLDLLTLTPSPVYGEEKDGVFYATVDVGDSESFMLIESDEIPALPTKERPRSAADIFLPARHATLLSRPVNALTLDTLSYSFDGIHFTNDVPLMQLKDELLRNRYEGPLTVKHTFTVGEMPANIHLAAEPLDYQTLTINGTPVTFGDGFWFDRSFRTADITPLVNVGENEICYTISYWQDPYVYEVLFSGVSESLRNCLCFDTEIECMYLFGDFRVKTDPARFEAPQHNAFTYSGTFSIVPQTDRVDLVNVIKDGYPFFAGELHVAVEHDYKSGDPTILSLTGRFAIGEVAVNGAFVKTLLFDNTCDLAPYLKEGKNVIELKLCNGNRNLMGPLHHAAIEPTNVTPIHFTGEKQWKDGEWKQYLKDRYCFVRFGVNCNDQ